MYFILFVYVAIEIENKIKGEGNKKKMEHGKIILRW